MRLLCFYRAYTADTHVSFPISDTMLKHNSLRMPVCQVHRISQFTKLAPPMRCLSLTGVPNVRRLFPSRHGILAVHRGEQVPMPHVATFSSSSFILPSYNATPSTARHHHHHNHPRSGVGDAQSLRCASERLPGSWLQQHSQELCVFRDADAASVPPIWALLICERVGQRRAAHECLRGRFGRHGDRGWLEQRWVACRTGRVFGQGTAKRQQRPQTHQTEAQRAEDDRSQDVFIAGMIYMLSRQLLPGAPSAPSLSGSTVVQRSEGGWWKLGECLRCALRSSRLAPPSG